MSVILQCFDQNSSNTLALIKIKTTKFCYAALLSKKMFLIWYKALHLTLFPVSNPIIIMFKHAWNNWTIIIRCSLEGICFSLPMLGFLSMVLVQ